MRRNDRYFVEFVQELQQNKQARYVYIIDCIDYDVVVNARIVANVALLDIVETHSHGRYRDCPLKESHKTYAELNDNAQEAIADAIKAVVNNF